MIPQIYLASQSPRRRQLLEQIQLPFAVLDVAIDETPQSQESAALYVGRVALLKAKAGWQQVIDLDLPRKPVLGADTTVVRDGHILGKPKDEIEGLAMLHSLSGREHQVLSAVAMVDEGREKLRVSVSQVQFSPLSPAQCQRYWATGEGRDKAGGYAIQGRAAVFVERLEGSYSGVMGLPLFELSGLLREFGIETV